MSLFNLFSRKLSHTTSGRRRSSGSSTSRQFESLESRQLLTAGIYPTSPVAAEESSAATPNPAAAAPGGDVVVNGLFDGNDSIGSAQYLGTINGDSSDGLVASESGSVSYLADRHDYYSIVLTRPSQVRFSLTGLKRDVDMHILNSSGGQVTTTTKSGTASEELNLSLSAGTYYIHLEKVGTKRSPYHLGVYTIGNNFGSADKVTVDTTSRVTYGQVGNGDSNDYYKFDVSGSRGVTLELIGLNGDADLFIYNSSGTQIGKSTNGTANSETIRINLNPGTYYVQVKPYVSSSINYTFRRSALPVGSFWVSEDKT